jgi:hypothetical protein
MEAYEEWNERHFHAEYRSEGGQRSYSWVKKQLQARQWVERGKRQGTHRKKRERKPLPGMMIHQEGSKHEGLPGQWHDLIVTLDDATGEHNSMFLVEEEGTASSLPGIRDVIEARGLPCSFYSDRGSHYGTTPEAGGKASALGLVPFWFSGNLGGCRIFPPRPSARAFRRVPFHPFPHDGTERGRLFPVCQPAHAAPFGEGARF